MQLIYTCLAWISVLSMVNGQGYMPLGKLRKGPPLEMDGHSNDVYEEMERSKQATQLPGGMAVLYASAPIFSPTSKDPEGAGEVYQILPEEVAVQQGVDSRRLLEDALIEMGFPLEELTEYRDGRVMRIHSKTADGKTESTAGDLRDASAILAALAGPLPYVRRGAWGKK